MKKYIGKYKKVIQKNKFKISAWVRNEELELLDGSSSVLDIQDYFEYILKKHGQKTYIPSIKKYLNKIKNRITFKIKTRNHFELLTPETMKLLENNKSKTTKDKNSENVPNLEMTLEITLV